jgi:hypothetical protein
LRSTPIAVAIVEAGSPTLDICSIALRWAFVG